MADRYFPTLYGTKEEDPISSLSSKFDELSKRLLGEDVENYDLVPKKPSDIARQDISLTREQIAETKKALPSIFESYLNRIKTQSLSPEEAAESFFNLSRATGGDIVNAYKRADRLRSQSPGTVAATSYERYKPAASLAISQLLGRPLGEQEYKNYVSAAQGLGISKGPDFQAFMGKSILSSPEYRSQAVVFDPEKTSKGIQALTSAVPKTSLQDYASMLGGL